MKYLHFSRSILLRAVHSLRHLSAIFLSVAIVVLFTAQAAYGAPQDTKIADQFNSAKGGLKKIDPIEQLRNSKELKLARVIINEFRFYIMPEPDSVVEQDGCRYDSQDPSAIVELYKIVWNSGVNFAKPSPHWLATYMIYFELNNGSTIRLFLSQQTDDVIKGRLNNKEVEVRGQIIDDLKSWAMKQKNSKPDCTYWKPPPLISK